MKFQLRRSILEAIGFGAASPVFKCTAFLIVICHILTGNSLTTVVSETQLIFHPYAGELENIMGPKELEVPTGIFFY